MHIISGRFSIELWPLIGVRIYAQYFVNEFMDFDQILCMHWYWQDVDLNDWTIFFVHFQIMALDWCRNFVYAQYRLAQLMDFEKIL